MILQWIFQWIYQSFFVIAVNFSHLVIIHSLIDVFVVYVTHSFDINGVIEEAQDDIGDSDKDDDTNEEEALMHIYFN